MDVAGKQRRQRPDNEHSRTCGNFCGGIFSDEPHVHRLLAHAEEQRHLTRLQNPHDVVDVETFANDAVRAGAQRAVETRAQSVNVKERQRDQQRVGARPAPGRADLRGDRGEVAVRDQRTLGASGRAAGVDHDRDVVGLDGRVGEFRRQRGIGRPAFDVGGVDERHLRRYVFARLSRADDEARRRIAEDVPEIGRAVEHVGRHADRAQPQQSEIRKHEAATVFRVDRDAIAAHHAAFGQATRNARGLTPKFGVRQLVDRRGVTPLGGDAPDHGNKGLGPKCYRHTPVLSVRPVDAFRENPDRAEDSEQAHPVRSSSMRDDTARAIAAIGTPLSPEMVGASQQLYQSQHETPPYRDVTVVRDERYGDDPRQRLDVFRSAAGGGAPKPVLIYVHGGGFVAGDKRVGDSAYYDNVALWAVRNGMVGVTITYRLAPANKYPAGAADVGGAVKWAIENIARFGGDPDNIVLFGQSAGSTHVSTYGARPELHPRPGGGVRAIAMLSGVYDFNATLDAATGGGDYLGDAPDARV